MAETKKLTKKVIYERIIEVLKGVDIEDKEVLINRLNTDIELLNKKNTSTGGTSKTQVENAQIKNVLLAELAKIGTPVTISDLMSKSEVIANYTLENGKHLSNQKINALFIQLLEDKKIVNTKDKKKSYFTVAW